MVCIFPIFLEAIKSCFTWGLTIIVLEVLLMATYFFVLVSMLWNWLWIDSVYWHWADTFWTETFPRRFSRIALHHGLWVIYVQFNKNKSEPYQPTLHSSTNTVFATYMSPSSHYQKSLRFWTSSPFWIPEGGKKKEERETSVFLNSFEFLEC